MARRAGGPRRVDPFAEAVRAGFAAHCRQLGTPPHWWKDDVPFGLGETLEGWALEAESGKPLVLDPTLILSALCAAGDPWERYASRFNMYCDNSRRWLIADGQFTEVDTSVESWREDVLRAHTEAVFRSYA